MPEQNLVEAQVIQKAPAPGAPQKPSMWKTFVDQFQKTTLKIVLGVVGLFIVIGLVVVLFIFTDLDLRFFPLSVVGEVVDSTGRPIAGATVVIDDEELLTNTDGRFTLSGVEQGEKTIIISKTDYETIEQTITVQKGIFDYTSEFGFQIGKLGVASITGSFIVPENPDYIFLEDFLEINGSIYKLEQNGTFEIRDIKSGQLEFNFRSTNYTDVTETVQLSEGDNDLGQFEIQPAGDIIVSTRSFLREDTVTDINVTAEGVSSAQIFEDEENEKLIIRDLEIGRDYKIRFTHPDYVDRTYERTVTQGENPLANFRLVEDHRLAYLYKEGSYLQLFSSQLDGLDRIAITEANVNPYVETLLDDLVYFLSSRDRVRSTINGISLLPYVAPASGGNPQRLIDSDEGFGQVYPSYENDLLINLTARDRSDDGLSLEAMSLDGRDKREIFRIEDGDIYGVRISDDGNMVAFGVADNDAENGLYAYDLESRTLNKLNNQLPLQIYDISADGDEILYTLVDESEELRDLFIFKQSTGQNIRIEAAVTGNLYQFIQGDANRIIYFDQRDERSNIYTLEVEGNTEKRITNYSGRTGVEAVYQQNGFILYQTNESLFVMDPEKLLPNKLVTTQFARYTGYDY